MAVIDILLASYNGEKYIETQILSIMSQSFRDWRLVIHDDGSIDDTLEIVKRLAAIDNRIELIEDNVKCGGAAANFMYLTRLAKAEYIMFCDQDDIWFDNKVEFMYSAIVKQDKSKPRVVYSNSYAWKPEEGIKGLSTLTFPRNIEQFLFLNSGMQGCVAIFNRSMCDILSAWNFKCAMHDHILHLAGIILGDVEYIKTPLMLYRNHENNVTGDTSTTSMDIVKIAKNSSFPVVDGLHYQAVERFYQIYRSSMSAENSSKIQTYLQMAQMGLWGRLYSVLRSNFQIFNSKTRLIIKIIIRPYINQTNSQC